MKYLVITFVFSSIVIAAPETSKKALPVKNIDVVKAKTAKKMNKDDIKEDCDDKAKKTVEIKEDSISILGGNTGCSLE